MSTDGGKSKEDAARTCSGILLGRKKKSEIMAFAATWMELEIIILSKVRKRKMNAICYYLCVESKLSHK